MDRAGKISLAVLLAVVLGFAITAILCAWLSAPTQLLKNVTGSYGVLTAAGVVGFGGFLVGKWSDL